MNYSESLSHSFSTPRRCVVGLIKLKCVHEADMFEMKDVVDLESKNNHNSSCMVKS